MSTPGPALAIDAAEWFVDEHWRQHVSRRHWRRLPRRAGIAVQLVVPVLRQAAVRATFFVPAELADREPERLRQLVDEGHEIALSVAVATPLDEVAVEQRAALIAAWRRDRAALEAATGSSVRGFRAAWCCGAKAPWWHDDLRDLGFVYDATAVRGNDAVRLGPEPVRRLDGGGTDVLLLAFAAWQIDREQPRLLGLPAALRAPHEVLLQRGAEALTAACRVAGGTVAEALGLAPAAPAAPASMDHNPNRPAPATAGSCRLQPEAPRLAIVVPLKDEAEGVVALLRELDVVAAELSEQVDCEFVIVDDGSTDRTWELLQRHAGGHARVLLVRHDQNRGVAAAIQTGMRATDAAWVASIDGDLSYDPMELRAMLPLLAGADVVTASPYHPRGGVANVPAWRLFLSRSLSVAYRVLLWRRIHTWTSCFRLYRREAVVDLPLDHGGFLGTAELLVRLLRRGGRVAEHPCVLEARLLGFSKMRVLQTVRGHLGLLCRTLLHRLH